MSPTLEDYQLTIYQEMMSHPALFSHADPKYVAIIGEKTANGIAQEVLKHPNIEQLWQTITPDESQNSRIQLLSSTDQKKNFFDIVILTPENNTPLLTQHYSLLRDGGILLYPSTSPFELAKLKLHHQELMSVGFSTIQTINFPAFDRPSGWCTVFMAIKNTDFRRVFEKQVFDRLFTTQYYNFDVHQASLVLPEFMREEFAT